MNARDIAERNALVVAERRARMPWVAEQLDELRKHFPGAAVKFAREAGHQFRAPDDEGVVASDNTNYIEAQQRKQHRRAG